MKPLKRKVVVDPVQMVVEDLQAPVPVLKKQRGPCRELDDFDADFAKRTIHNMQLIVSVRQLSDVIVERGVRMTKPRGHKTYINGHFHFRI